MPISSENAWGLFLPQETTNSVSNPSFELGTAGWGGTASATIGSASDAQAFGAWAGRITGANNGAGATFGGLALTSGAPYTASVYARMGGASGGSVQLNLGGTSTRVPVGTAWQRVSVGTTPGANVTATLAVQRFSANAGTLDFDGVQVEQGPLTSYCDGDQEGCIWLGAAHQSQSLRDGQSRAGGTLVALADLGFTVDMQTGIGMPGVENNAQEYALLPGAQFQFQRAASRTFTLLSLVDGQSREGLHARRRAIIDALKIDRVTPQQPTRFVYLGAGGTSYIDAVYQAGLEYNDIAATNAGAENVAITFTAFDPYWRNELDQGTALAPRVALGSANYLVARDPFGRWGTFAGFTNTVFALESVNGTTFVGGAFGSAGGTASPRIAQIVNGNIGTLTGGTVNNTVRALEWSPSGTLFVGGDFTLTQGTPGGRFLVQHTGGAWGTVGPGTVDTSVFSLAYTPAGTLFAGGAFSFANGTRTRFAAQYAGAWGSLAASGTISSFVHDVLPHPRTGTVYLGGQWETIGGTAAPAAGQWNGAGYGTLGAVRGYPAAGTSVRAMTFLPNFELAAVGDFETADGGTVGDAAIWNGVAWRAAGQGLGSLSTDILYAVLSDGKGGMYAAGVNAYLNTRPSPSNLNYYNGYAWLSADIGIQGNASDMQALAIDTGGTLYVGGAFNGTAYAASVATIINSGMTDAYPVAVMKNTASSGTARVYQLLNTLTGDRLYFDLVVMAGETVTLDMRPGGRSLTSDYRGDLFSAIVPGSNLAGWRLASGSNLVSFFAENDTVRVSLSWRPRQWSADGTV